ncbi:hypothetical protein VN12_00620 [Pirellula sp. SH-Sr6A]|nr:hypothetical protein VN12_00620 [Pirellula sp. SH-Sr6A]
MLGMQISGVDVSTSSLTQIAFRAAPCELLVRVTPDNQEQALKLFRENQSGLSGLRVQGVRGQIAVPEIAVPLIAISSVPYRRHQELPV